MGREERSKAVQADGQHSLFQMQVFLCIFLDFREVKIEVQGQVGHLQSGILRRI